MMKPGSSTVQLEFPSRRAISASPAAVSTMPPPTVNRGGTLSTSRATIGAATNEATVNGRKRSPAWKGP